MIWGTMVWGFIKKACGFIKKFWLPLLIVTIFSTVAIKYNLMASKIDKLEAQNTVYLSELETLRANDVTVETMRDEVKVCTDQIAAAQALSAEWQARYDAARSRPARVVRVPVEVAAPGTPCAEAVADIAAWLAEEVAK